MTQNEDDKPLANEDLTGKLDNDLNDFSGLPEEPAKVAEPVEVSNDAIKEALEAGQTAAKEKKKITDGEGNEIDPETLIPLPPKDGYEKFIETMRANGAFTHLLEDGSWPESDREFIAFIGHPFIYAERIENDLGQLKELRKHVQPLGIPIIELRYDSPTHCIICVRGDVYREVE